MVGWRPERATTCATPAQRPQLITAPHRTTPHRFSSRRSVSRRVAPCCPNSYLDTYKTYEHKPATAIQERVESEFWPKVTDCLTVVRSVNKTDVATLLHTFGSVAGCMRASMEDLAMCPSFGAKKVRRLYDSFHESLAATDAGDGRPAPR